MPQINLLAPTSKKRTAREKSFELPKVDVVALSKSVVPATVPLLVVLVSISVVLFVISGRKGVELERLNKKSQSVSINPQELVEFNNRKAALEKKIALLTSLSAHKSLWVEELDDISNCLPKGVWLTEILVEKKNYSDDQKKKKEELEQSILIIKGSAIAPQIDDAVSFIGEFVNALKQKPSFAQDFSEIKLNSINKGAIGKSDVMNFELVCILL
ncbi:MAG: PilN domain-containing protein [Candidatus Omnitrophota bacterium]|nr:PilN domain-containing protein [Candidatus Omnitrophota bacterium]